MAMSAQFKQAQDNAGVDELSKDVPTPIMIVPRGGSNVVGLADGKNLKLVPEPSALSRLDFRIDRGEFRAGVIDPHVPFDATLAGVDVGRPGRRLAPQGLDV